MAASAVYTKTADGRRYQGRLGVDRAVVLNRALAKDTIITTPEYVVGSHGLHVYYGGIRCLCGTDENIHAYAEIGVPGAISTTIQWLQDTPSTFSVIIEST